MPDRPRMIAALPARKNQQYNPFQFLLYQALEPYGYQAIEFESAFRRLPRVDLVHLHWPDAAVLVKDKGSAIRRFLTFFAALSCYKLRGVPIVWTAHNLTSHDGFQPVMERLFWKALFPLLDAVICLQPPARCRDLLGSTSLAGIPFVHMPHPEYRTYYEKFRPSAMEAPILEPSSSPADKFLVFGQIRPYKRIPETIRAFGSCSDPNARLQIAGQCFDQELRARIKAAAAHDPRIDLQLRFIQEEEVAGFFRNCRALVLGQNPQKNSGAAHLAASFGVPVVLQPTTSESWSRRHFLPEPPSWHQSASSHARLFDALLDATAL